MLDVLAAVSSAMRRTAASMTSALLIEGIPSAAPTAAHSAASVGIMSATESSNKAPLGPSSNTFENTRVKVGTGSSYGQRHRYGVDNGVDHQLAHQHLLPLSMRDPPTLPEPRSLKQTRRRPCGRLPGGS